MRYLRLVIKDLKQSFRSRIALVFMFGVPVLVTVLFYFMIGSIAGGESGDLDLPQSEVVMVNMDSGGLPEMGQFEFDELPFDVPMDLAGITSMGGILQYIFQGEGMADIMQVQLMDDPDQTWQEAVYYWD